MVGFEWKVAGGVEKDWGSESGRKGYTWIDMFVLVLVLQNAL